MVLSMLCSHCFTLVRAKTLAEKFAQTLRVGFGSLVGFSNPRIGLRFEIRITILKSNMAAV